MRDPESWLADIHPGDKVIEVHIHSGQRTREIREVEKVTPSGRVSLRNIDRIYNPDGTMRGRTGSSWYVLEAWSTEAERHVVDANDLGRLVSRFRHFTEWQRLPVDTLREIEALVDRHAPAKAPSCPEGLNPEERAELVRLRDFASSDCGLGAPALNRLAFLENQERRFSIPPTP